MLDCFESSLILLSRVHILLSIGTIGRSSRAYTTSWKLQAYSRPSRDLLKPTFASRQDRPQKLQRHAIGNQVKQTKSWPTTGATSLGMIPPQARKKHRQQERRKHDVLAIIITSHEASTLSMSLIVNTLESALPAEGVVIILIVREQHIYEHGAENVFSFQPGIRML